MQHVTTCSHVFQSSSCPYAVVYTGLTLCFLAVSRYMVRVGACVEMVHYVTGAPRIVPVCPARPWGECDVQNLTVVGPNPGETGALLFPCVRHTQPHTHRHTPTPTHTRVQTTQRDTHMEPFKVFPLPLFPNAPRINTRSRSEPNDPH